MIFTMIRKRPKKIKYVERFGLYHPEYGVTEFEEAQIEEDD